MEMVLKSKGEGSVRPSRGGNAVLWNGIGIVRPQGQDGADLARILEFNSSSRPVVEKLFKSNGFSNYIY